jgi:hypothetical protein
LQIRTKIVICHTANSKPVKQEADGTVILPPLVFPSVSISYFFCVCLPVGNVILYEEHRDFSEYYDLNDEDLKGEKERERERERENSNL